jgi:hypothetical protein
MTLNSKAPEGPLAEKWDKHKFNVKLVNPANKRKYDVIVVGTGLAGASAAASLAELGYNVKAFKSSKSPEPPTTTPLCERLSLIKTKSRSAKNRASSPKCPQSLNPLKPCTNTTTGWGWPVGW